MPYKRARSNSQKFSKGQNAENRKTRVCEKCVESAHRFCFVIGGILSAALITFLALWLKAQCECTDNRLQNGTLSRGDERSLSPEDERCLVNDAKKGLECMSCNAPTLMKLPMSRDLLGHFIPDVGYVALLGCLNATSYCHDPELECCPDVEGKVSRNISLVGTSKQLHVKRHYEIFEFTKCKCQPRDKCIRRKDVIGKFVQEEVV